MHNSNSLDAAPQDSSMGLLASSQGWRVVNVRPPAIAKALLYDPQAPWMGITLGILLVSVPVFFEAPLVRTAPWIAVLLTGVWVGSSLYLCRHRRTEFLGDLLWGLSWSWLAGAIYWGWFRWEPLWHLPIEAIGLPMALWGIYRRWRPVGHWFYLGSLLGTAVTDMYFYQMDLMPHWRRLMSAPPSETMAIVAASFTQIQTTAGVGIAVGCASVLLALSWLSGRSPQRHHWLFSGTLIGTLLVDGLFVVLASR
ncbi:MAG: DUF3120 domain-containing protein [Cyanobacteria bacterium P01_C01_bin.120]